MSLTLFLMLVTAGPGSFARLPAPPALELQVNFEHDFPPDFRQQLVSITDSALQLVRRYPPKGYENNLFQWSSDRKTLDGKTFHLTFATSKSSFLQQLRQMPGGLPPDTDSLTLAGASFNPDRMNIHLCLLVDKIFYDQNGTERRDSLAHLIVALAHEIYGNVQTYLEIPTSSMQTMTLEMRRQTQERGFQASIRFLEEIMTKPEFQRFPPSLQQSFPAMLENERRGLEYWKKQ